MADTPPRAKVTHVAPGDAIGAPDDVLLYFSDGRVMQVSAGRQVIWVWPSEQAMLAGDQSLAAITVTL